MRTYRRESCLTSHEPKSNREVKQVTKVIGNTLFWQQRPRGNKKNVEDKDEPDASGMNMRYITRKCGINTKFMMCSVFLCRFA